MGVADAGPFIRRLQKQIEASRIHRENETILDIQTLHHGLGDTFRHIRRAHTACKKYNIVIDFWATYRARFISLCNQMVCPSSLHKTGQHYYPDSKKLVSIEDASEKILDELMQDLRVQVRTARQELEGCDVQVLVVLDDPTKDVLAKFCTKLRRKGTSEGIRSRYNRSKAHIENLISAADNRARKQKVKATRLDVNRLRGRFGKRSDPMAVCFRDLRETVWSQVSLNTSIEGLRASAQRICQNGELSCYAEHTLPCSYADKEDIICEKAHPFEDDDEDEDDNDADRTFSSYTDGRFAIPSELDIETSLTEWKKLNSDLMKPTTSIKIVLSSNEADLTILNYLAAASQDAINIVMSCDSDFPFFAETSHLQYTVSYSSFHRKYGTPWCLTNVSEFHHTTGTAWPNRRSRIMAALLSGHDYTGNGIHGAGLWTLLKGPSIVSEPSVWQMVKSLEGKRGSYWKKAIAELKLGSEDSDVTFLLPINRILHAMRVLLIRQHRTVEGRHRTAIEESFTGKKPTSLISSYANPFSLLAVERRNIKLQWPFTSPQHKQQGAHPRQRQSDTQSKKMSTHLAKSPNYSLPHKRHNAWTYDPSKVEKPRPRKLVHNDASPTNTRSTLPGSAPILPLPSTSTTGAHMTMAATGNDENASLLRPAVDIQFYGDNNDAEEDQEEEEEEVDEEPNEYEEGASEEDDDGENDQGVQPGSKRPASTKASSSKKASRVAGSEHSKTNPKLTALKLFETFPTKTHNRWLPSILQSLLPNQIRQREKPLLSFIRLATFAERLSLRHTLVPVYQEYYRRLGRDGELGYLFAYRHFFAKRMANETDFWRDVLRAWSTPRATQRTGRSRQFAFHQTATSGPEIAGMVASIVDKWMKLHCTTVSPAYQQDKCREIMTRRLTQCDSRVIHFLHTHLGKYDLLQAELMSEANGKSPTVPDIPLAPFSNRQAHLDHHNKKLYLAQKSTLRSKPMQEHLSGYILEVCNQEGNDLGPSALNRLHAGVYHAFIGTSLEDRDEEKWSEDSSTALSQATEVIGQERADAILNFLYIKLRSYLEPSAWHLSLADIFRGKDKLQFGLKYLKLFFIRVLNYDFTFTYEPTFVAWDSTRIWLGAGEAVNDAMTIIDWINAFYILALRQPVTLKYRQGPTSRPFGILDELWCFEHVASGNRLLADFRGRPHLKINQQWADGMQEFWIEVKGRLSNRPDRESRSSLFDILFKRCIPRKEIWAGRFETDGLNVRMASIDPKVCAPTPAISNAIAEYPEGRLAEHGHDDANIQADALIHSIVKYTKQSFGTEFDLHRSDYGSRISAARNHMTKSSAILPTGHYLKKNLSHTAVTFVKKLPTSSTSEGLPKDISILSEASAETFRDELKEWAAGCGDGHLMTAGVDLGEIVSQAIHVNDPSRIEAFLIDHARERHPSSHTSPAAESCHDRSRTFMVKPHALQEITRSTVRMKQVLRERLPVSTSEIQTALRDTPSVISPLKKLSNLTEVAFTAGRPYCHAGFRRVQRIRQFHDRIFTQFRSVVWEKHCKNSHLLMVVGDGCGLQRGNTRKNRKHTAHFAESGLRELIKRLRSHRLPVKFAIVNEAYSSQVCPDPDCIVTDGQEEAEQGCRSRMGKGKFLVSGKECQRVLQCATCKRTYHRDIAAGMNIGFIGWHLLTHGQHPWFKTSGAG